MDGNWPLSFFFFLRFHSSRSIKTYRKGLRQYQAVFNSRLVYNPYICSPSDPNWHSPNFKDYPLPLLNS